MTVLVDGLVDLRSYHDFYLMQLLLRNQLNVGVVQRYRADICSI